MLLINLFVAFQTIKVSIKGIRRQRNGMVDVPAGIPRRQIPRLPHRSHQHASAWPDSRIFAVPFPQFVNSYLCQLRDTSDVAEPSSGDITQLLSNGSHPLFEPN